MHTIVITPSFKKDYKKVEKYPNFKKSVFEHCIQTLANGEKLPANFKDHSLGEGVRGHYKGMRDFHLVANIIVIYEITGGELHLVRIGSHGNLFATY